MVSGVLFCTLALSAVIPIILAIFRNPLYCDSAYYLCLAERIAEGNKLYRDLGCGYSPLWFYITAGLKLTFNITNGNVVPYFCFHFCLLTLCATFITLILRELAVDIKASVFSGWIFLMVAHWMQGNEILLEVPSMAFGLSAIFFSIKLRNQSVVHFIIIGVLCACSFLCKQFGLGFFGLTCAVVLLYSDAKFSKLLTLCLGFLIPILICFAIWKAGFVHVLLPGYGTKSAAEAGRDVGTMSKLGDIYDNFIELCTRVALILPISLLFIRACYREGKLKAFILCWCGVLGFMLQFYFVPGGMHYKLYAVPFIAIIVGILLSLDLKHCWHKCLLYIPLSITVLYSVYADYNNRIRKIYLHPEKKSKDMVIADKISTIVQDSSLWIVHGGLFPVYYYSSLLPPNMKTIGYSFGPLGLNESKGFEQAEKADYVLSFVADYPFESFYTDSLRDFVWQHEVIYITDEVVLHDMRKKLQY